jgi:hypothetical protein
MCPRDLARLVAADLVRFDAAGPAEPLNPQNGRADPNPELRRCLMARQATLDHRRDNSLT